MEFMSMLAIGLTKDAPIAIKKLAYLYCHYNIIQNTSNDLGIMIVNSFHNDLNSKEPMNNNIALD
jgi:vesicle coat complex subunit